jgi:hypothetical protein
MTNSNKLTIFACHWSDRTAIGFYFQKEFVWLEENLQSCIASFKWKDTPDTQIKDDLLQISRANSVVVIFPAIAWVPWMQWQKNWVQIECPREQHLYMAYDWPGAWCLDFFCCLHPSLFGSMQHSKVRNWRRLNEDTRFEGNWNVHVIAFSEAVKLLRPHLVGSFYDVTAVEPWLNQM